MRNKLVPLPSYLRNGILTDFLLITNLFIQKFYFFFASLYVSLDLLLLLHKVSL